MLGLFAVVMCVSCARKSDDVTLITNKFVSTDPNSRIQSMDLSGAGLGVSVYSECKGSLRGNSEAVNPLGVPEGHVKIEGNYVVGTISFGHLYRPTDVNDPMKETCDTITKERYSYTTDSTGVTLCNLNCLEGKYGPACQSEAVACGRLTLVK